MAEQGSSRMNMDVGRMHIGPCIPGENRPGAAKPEPGGLASF